MWGILIPMVIITVIITKIIIITVITIIIFTFFNLMDLQFKEYVLQAQGKAHGQRERTNLLIAGQGNVLKTGTMLSWQRAILSKIAFELPRASTFCARSLKSIPEASNAAWM